jgi:SAM-dependent methyltransferase
MSAANADQASFWTEGAGQKWVEQQQVLDAFLQPVLDGVLSRAGLQPGQSVLDIGCGTGASTLQAAEIVGQTGTVLGVDFSPTMLALAGRRAAGKRNVRFLEADAEDHPFDRMAFDAMISRFRVMFFSDSLKAFSNIAKSLKPGAQVTFAAWGQIDKNPWFTTAAQAAKAQLGAPPAVDPDDPGPFAFRNPAHVVRMLSRAGFVEAETEVIALDLAPPGTPEEVARMATSVGPAARTVEHFQGSADDSAAIAARVQTAFQRFETAQGVRIPGEINFFVARVPAA